MLYTPSSESSTVSMKTVCYIVMKCGERVQIGWPPMWSSCQSSQIQTQRSQFRFPCYHIFWEIVGLELGLLNLVRIIQEPVEWEVATPVYKIEINGRGDPSRVTQDAPLSAKVGIKFADQRRSRSQCRSLAYWKPQSLFVFVEWRLDSNGSG
jgi:hypothetical protein